MSASPNPPSLFPLHGSDAAWLAELHHMGFDSGHAWGPDVFADMLKTPAAIGFGLRHHDGPLAFILANAVADEAEILTLVTHSQHLRRGYATQLIRALADELKKRNIKKIFLEVATDNPSALAAYTAFGFKNISVRKNYYKRPGNGHGHDVDAIMMRHDLA